MLTACRLPPEGDISEEDEDLEEAGSKITSLEMREHQLLGSKPAGSGSKT